MKKLRNEEFANFSEIFYLVLWYLRREGKSLIDIHSNVYVSLEKACWDFKTQGKSIKMLYSDYT